MRRRLTTIPGGLSNAPGAIVAVVTLLLLSGIGIIIQNEAAYRDFQVQETRVQAEILAANVTAALDFGDAQAAQEAVDAIRVNRQVRAVGIYDLGGALVAGYGRDGTDPPRQLTQLQPSRQAVLTARVPVQSSGERIGSVLLVSDAEPVSRRLNRYMVMGLLVVMAALVIIVLGIGQNALRRANRKLEERANTLVATNAELKVQITERTRAEDQLRQSQKLQALGQLTGGIAHDFNNLLTVIQGSADMLRRPGLDEAKRIRFADAVVQASSRAAALTGQLLAFARRQPLQPEVIDVNALIQGMTDLLDRTLGERIAIATDLTAGRCAVEADRAQLESALLNIAVNARDAMPDGGTLTIGTALREEGADGNMVAIFVTDSGFGMDAETLGRAIEPFFTTKSMGKGTGLGLSQVYGFATQSGGDVRISSTPGVGTTVTLLLPFSGDALDHRDEARVGRLQPRRTGRILLAEDNEEVGEFAQTLLSELGHEVRWARTGEEALELAAREPFDAVFSDVVMPGMSGLELAEVLAAQQPQLPVILTTGYSDEIAETGTGGRPVILKPYRLETLSSALDQALRDRQERS
ncbi:CHASE sensor domain-containing protein [Sphingosinicella terrae]|uniref:CHASE sensor domain-containing protein n=1 Tax=Sphingosinicella terrae TaxID=2172047 RepID=UPI000E0D94FA|nr:CHASE sensor domain-containing protein [Sphingosinicella terrae]